MLFISDYVINDHFVLVLIAMSFPAVVRRGAQVCVICIGRGLISYLFLFLLCNCRAGDSCRICVICIYLLVAVSNTFSVFQ